jgi:transglutaminase-like putative cysteine protease
MKQKSTLHTAVQLFLETVVGALGIFGALFCLCTAFAEKRPNGAAVPIPLPDVVWIVIPLLLLTVAVLARIRSGGWYTLALGLALLLVAFLLRRQLWLQARALWNVLAYQYRQGYVQLRSAYDPKLGLNYPAASRFLLPLSILMAFFMGLAVSRWRTAAVAALALVPGIAPCFVLLDTPPSRIALFCAALCVLTLLFSQNVRRREIRETGRAFFWGALLSAALLAALPAIFPEKTYQPPLTWKELTDKLNQFSAEAENRPIEEAGLSGNPSAINLNELSPLPNRPKSVMRITTDYPERLYLAGTNYAGFDGGTWTRLSEQEWPVLSVAWPSLVIDSQPYTLEVEPIQEESVCYYPDHPTAIPDYAEPVSDAYIRNPNPKDPYSIGFYPNLTVVFALNRGDGSILYREEGSPYDSIWIPNDWFYLDVDNRAYADWVNENCLYLPDQTRSGLLAWLDEHSNESLTNLPVPDRAAVIAAMVSEAAPYSRDAKAPPAGKDFATWFLTEADSGYCVHYATTAAALLRAVGIPSRYVSGYVCNPVPGEQTTVTSMMAHAWAEYYDGNGWVRIEATPGDATEFTGEVPTQRHDETEFTLPPVTRPTRPPETSPDTEPTGSPETVIVPPAPTATTAPGTPGSEPKGSESFRMPTWAWWVLGVLAGIGLLIARRHAAMALRKHKLDRADANGKGILLYRRCRSLLAHVKMTPQPEAEELGKKAAFSQHELTEDELKLLKRHQAVAERLLCRSGFFRQLWYKYVLAIL